MKLKRDVNSFQNTNSDTDENVNAAAASAPRATKTTPSALRALRAGHSHATSAKGSSQNTPTARSYTAPIASQPAARHGRNSTASPLNSARPSRVSVLTARKTTRATPA